MREVIHETDEYKITIQLKDINEATWTTILSDVAGTLLNLKYFSPTLEAMRSEEYDWDAGTDE